MQGRIIKGIAGFYYVYAGESGICECKAKGIFRKERKKPLVGDRVTVSGYAAAPEDGRLPTGTIEEILPRTNALYRPAAANVDQALALFTIQSPKIAPSVLDRFLVQMRSQDIPCLICFNKADLTDEDELRHWTRVYENAGYTVFSICAAKKEGLDAVRERLRGKTTVLAGPSGVGKSTTVNALQPNIQMETGAISERLRRGKHTTRHAELIYAGADTWLMDTPGFASFQSEQITAEDLKTYFPEFHPYEGKCRFSGCAHISEPDCAVKDALAKGTIDPGRYENYRLFYEELREKEKRRFK